MRKNELLLEAVKKDGVITELQKELDIYKDFFKDMKETTQTNQYNSFENLQNKIKSLVDRTSEKLNSY